MGIFGKLFGALKKTKDGFAEKMRQLFSRNKLGDEFYEDLEEVLISADVSVSTAEKVVEGIKERAKAEKLKDPDYVTGLLKEVLTDMLKAAEVSEIEYPCVIMVVGVNGVGKTTTIGKLANYYVSQGKSVTLAAADTFRAAAAEQLAVWADRAKVRIVRHEEDGRADRGYGGQIACERQSDERIAEDEPRGGTRLSRSGLFKTARARRHHGAERAFAG